MLLNMPGHDTRPMIVSIRHCAKAIEFLCKRHFDVFDLLEKGEAVEMKVMEKNF